MNNADEVQRAQQASINLDWQLEEIRDDTDGNLMLGGGVFDGMFVRYTPDNLAKMVAIMDAVFQKMATDSVNSISICGLKLSPSAWGSLGQDAQYAMRGAYNSFLTALRHKGNLAEVSLFFTDLSDEESASLVKAVHESNVKDFAIDDLGDESAAAITNLILNNNVVETLGVDLQHSTYEVVKDMLGALEKNQHLNKFSITIYDTSGVDSQEKADELRRIVVNALKQNVQLEFNIWYINTRYTYMAGEVHIEFGEEWTNESLHEQAQAGMGKSAKPVA